MDFTVLASQQCFSLDGLHSFFCFQVLQSLYQSFLLFSFVSRSYYYYSLEFFTSVLADCFSLEFKWQQVFSSPQDLPNVPITIGTIITFMFHSFFNSLARSRYLSFFSLSFRFILWSAWTAKSTIWQILFFCWLLWGLVFWPGLGDPFVY